MLLYNRAGSVTGKRIARELGIKAIRDSKWKYRHGPPLIRWGASLPIPDDFCDLNSAEGIGKAAHTLKSYDTFKENEINCPQYWRVPYDELPTDRVLLARRYNHRAGQDIILCDNERKVEHALQSGRTLFVEFIKTSKELRVHVINNEPVKAFRKVYREEVIDDPLFIRSSEFGWGYKLVNGEKYYSDALELAVKAVGALKLKFGAVDLALDNINDRWIVWEVNSAPGLNSQTLQLYISFLRSYLNARRSKNL